MSPDMLSMVWRSYRTPFGEGRVVVDSKDRIQLIALPRGFNIERINGFDGLREEKKPGTFAAWVARQLEAYFEDGAEPESLAAHLADTPLTDFQRRIRKACLKIRRGQVLTYGELAEKAGYDKSRYGRPVGQCMAKNPFPLVVPCHRVLSDGHRVGHYGGGVDMKRHLLECEGALQLTRG